MRLQAKIILIAVPLALVGGLGTAVLCRQAVHAVLTRQVGSRALWKGGEMRTAVVAFQNGKESGLLPLLKRALDGGAAYAVALDPAGRVLAHSNVAEKGKVYGDPLIANPAGGPVFKEIRADGRPLLDVSMPVRTSLSDPAEEFILSGKNEGQGDVFLGVLRMGLPLDDALDAENRILRNVLLTMGAVGGLALVVALLFVRRVLRPLQPLVEATQQVARGHYGQQVPTSSDELGDLSRQFNRMSRELLETTVSKDFMDGIMGNMMDALVVARMDGNIRMINHTALALSGLSEEDVLGKPMGTLFAGPDDLLLGHRSERLLREESIESIEAFIVSRNGMRIPVLAGVSLFREKGGAPAGFIVSAKDITTLKKAEEALRGFRDELELRVRERTTQLTESNARLLLEMQEHARAEEMQKELEQQLRQSQKMEAVGQLAGGVAHDFNNLLTVIMGFAQILLSATPKDDNRRMGLEQIAGASERAASLTRQLLAFSRKQILKPRALNLNEVISGMDGILRRLIGEDVELSADLDGNLEPVKADPGQLEQVLLNMVVNARDAMPQGGKIVLRTCNEDIGGSDVWGGEAVTPGSYVRLDVEDNGCGMDAATRVRIFEPFFTTKEAGKGTGLGLSTVYGIVRQSGGHIRVESEPGKGSTFHIYLPRSTQGASAAVAAAKPKAAPGSGTILVVEDEPAVRALAREVLQGAGYSVLEAAGAEAAMSISRNHAGSIDLLLTDVVMPKTSGRDLAARIARSRPDIKVLFVSGYTDDIISRHGVLDPETAFLEKPFVPETLLNKVQETLGRRSS